MMNALKLPFDTAWLPYTAGVYLVGGSVRDLLLGRHCVDYDIAVSENPADFARRLARRTGGRRVCLGKSDQVLFRVLGPDAAFDITPVRGPSIESDLGKRDFTVNAMAYALDTQTLIDPFHGKAHLAAGQLNAVTESVFDSDPVRLVRAFRICAAYGLEMPPATDALIRTKSPHIQRSPPERITGELFRILALPGTPATLARMAHSDVLFQVLPELKETVGCMQHRQHAFDVFQHTLTALRHLERLQKDTEAVFPETASRIRDLLDEKTAVLLKWAMLLHDIGKPRVKTVGRTGALRFHGHEKAGAQAADGICRRLRFSKADTEKTVFFIRHHIKPLFLYLACRNPGSRKRIRTRFFLRYNDQTPALFLHAVADIQGKSDRFDPRNQAFIDFARHLLRDYFQEYRETKKTPPFLTGFDLIRDFGLEPSPAIKRILNRLREAQLSGEIRDEPSARRLARKLMHRITASNGRDPENPAG
jgi:tRNA nucleotidyltransferase/poly(A) polymerase